MSYCMWKYIFPSTSRIQQLMLRPHQDVYHSLGLQFQWGGSHANTSLLRCLGVDERNIVSLSTAAFLTTTISISWWHCCTHFMAPWLNRNADSNRSFICWYVVYIFDWLNEYFIYLWGKLFFVSWKLFMGTKKQPVTVSTYVSGLVSC